MSFHLTETQTLHAVAFGDEQTLLEDLQQRIEVAAQEARQMPEVVESDAVQQAAGAHLARLKKAGRNLHQHAKYLGEKVSDAKESALAALIDSAVDTQKIDYKGLVEVGQQENRARYTARAIEHLTERLIPLAQLAALREESHAAVTFARALEQMAQERAERLLTQLREAVTEEVVLPVDVSKGVCGALMAQAAEYRTRAMQLSETADHIEESVTHRMGTNL